MMKESRVQAAVERAANDFAAFEAANFNGISQPTLACFTNDPLSGEIEFTLFTDDGHGNGTVIFTVAAADLLAIIEKFKLKQTRIFEGLDPEGDDDGN